MRTHLGGLMVALVLMTACGDDGTAPACTDGVQNGDEAGVDCGGACGATCELGAACNGAADCLFGVCSDGACAPPTEGPEPTGPIAATIPPEGGTVRVVTDERVAVTLTFPAGAVGAPLDVMVTPRTPATRSWTEVALAPTGAVLAVPVQVVVELPPQVIEAADGLLAFGASTPTLYLETVAVEHRLTGESIVLGQPALPEGAMARVMATLGPGELLIARPMSLEARVALARELLAQLRANHRYGDALQLIGTYAALAQLSGDPGFEALVQPMVDEAYPVACDGLTEAVSRLEASEPSCASEHHRFARPVLDWVALLQKLEGLVATPTCAPGATYADAVRATAQRTVANMRSDRAAFLRCECSETPVEEWSGVQQLECPRIQSSARLAAGPGEPVLFDDPGDWDVAVDSVTRAGLEVVKTQLVDLGADAALLQEAVVDPLITLLREMTYAACVRDGHPENVGKLLRVLPGRAELLEDAQYCASPLRVEPLAADASTATGAPVDLGAAASPGAQTRSAEIGVAPTGWVRLSGPIGALRCPDQAESEPDELVAIVRASGGDVEVGRRVAGAQGLLVPPLELEIDALRTAAGLTATDPTDVRLDVVRETTGCGGLYGGAEVTLFELQVVERMLVHLRFDDGAGAIAADSSGNGHDATLVGGAGFGAGQCGGALAVGTTGQYGEIPDDSAYDLPGEYTLAAWINYQDNDRYHIIASHIGETDGWLFGIGDAGAGTTYLRFSIANSPGDVNGDCNYGIAAGSDLAGGWHHIAVAGAAGAPFTMYLDGVALGSSAIGCTSMAVARPLTIGGDPALPNGVNGLLDDFRFYDRTLSEAEIAALAGPTCGM